MRSLGRKLAGVGLIAGPVLFVIANIVSPAWGDDTAEYLDEVAGSETAHVLSALVFMIGGLLLIAGLIGVIRLMRGRGSALGQIAAAMMIVGAVTATSFYPISVIEAEAVDGAYDRGQMVGLLEQAEESAAALPVFVPFLVGIVLGSILLAVALWRTRVVPIWAPIALVVSTVVGFFSQSQLVGVASFVLLAAGLGAVGLKILSLSDADWDRMAVAPGPEEPPAAAAEPPAPTTVQG